MTLSRNVLYLLLEAPPELNPPSFPFSSSTAR